MLSKASILEALFEKGFHSPKIAEFVWYIATQREITDTTREIAEKFGISEIYASLIVKKLRNAQVIDVAYEKRQGIVRKIRLHADFLKEANVV